MSTGRYTPLRHVRLMLERQDGKCACGCGAVLILGPRGRRVNFIVEHIQAKGRRGSNALKNKDLRTIECGRKKTFHPRSEATTLCGDNYEIKKTPRMRRKHKVVKGRKRESSWPKGRKLQGRGFAKVHRPMGRSQ